MHVQEIYYRRPDRAEVSFHLTSGAKWRLTERCVAIVRLLAEIRHQQWLRANRSGPIAPARYSKTIPLPGDRFEETARLAPSAASSERLSHGSRARIDTRHGPAPMCSLYDALRIVAKGEKEDVSAEGMYL